MTQQNPKNPESLRKYWRLAQRRCRKKKKEAIKNGKKE